MLVVIQPLEIVDLIEESETRSPIQFSLRLLILATAVIAAVFAFPLQSMEFVDSWFYLVISITIAVVFTISRSISNRRILLAIILFIPFASVLAYACFARYRLIAAIDDVNWPRPFPYPDAFLDAVITSWLAPSGDMLSNSIDIDGAYVKLWFTVAFVSIIAAVVVGWTIGMAVRPRWARQQ